MIQGYRNLKIQEQLPLTVLQVVVLQQESTEHHSRTVRQVTTSRNLVMSTQARATEVYVKLV